MRRGKIDRGDIIRITFNPTSGREQQGDSRPAMVLSPAAFNALGLALVAPITQGGNFSRDAGFAVPLTGSGCETQGAVLVNQIRSMDLEARQAKRIEKAPQAVVDDALARVQALLE
ncbi:type II toxin-antitoxin system ChpB family toxin [Pseudomonas sp. App30]|uniref:type II toxin-antitoxin system ChpB family toxin n=1 Tax=Pseudomonas sp. App30 TaxID=3068990 RepID=UPI003A803B89